MSEKKAPNQSEIKKPSSNGKGRPEHRGDGSKAPIFKTPNARPPKK